MRAALIKDGIVQNTVVLPDDWTGESREWQAPEGLTVVAAAAAAPGDIYDGEVFTKPAAPVKPPAPLEKLVIADRLTDAEVAVVASLQSGGAQQQRWWLRWVSAETVNPANPEVVAGFQAVFGRARAAELLAQPEN